ncbi:hypothetical protein BDW69DRAFT_106270 [Aspergillus filifer]
MIPQSTADCWACKRGARNPGPVSHTELELKRPFPLQKDEEAILLTSSEARDAHAALLGMSRIGQREPRRHFAVHKRIQYLDCAVKSTCLRLLIGTAGIPCLSVPTSPPELRPHSVAPASCLPAGSPKPPHNNFFCQCEAPLRTQLLHLDSCLCVI